MRLLTKKVRSRLLGSPASHRARLRVEELESRLVPYSLSGNAWPHPELITIGFVPDGTNLGGVYSNLISNFNSRGTLGSQGFWQSQILRGAQVWAQQTNINFALVADNGAPSGSGDYQQGDPAMPDIRIGGFSASTSTLAWATLPPPGNNWSIAGDIEFNTSQAWNINAHYDLFTVAMHEVGHALGLLHSTDYYSAMYPMYVGIRRGLGTDDINGIRAIYSAGTGRSPDAYDAAAPNGSFSTATNLNSLIDPTTLTALTPYLDITTTSDADFYTFTAPAGTSGTLTVKLQSSGLSLLAPSLTVYNAAQQVIGSAVAGQYQYGVTLTVTVTGVTAGQQFYVKAAGKDTTPFGTGRYALTLNFGTGPSPVVPLPNTQTPIGSPLSVAPGLAQDSHDHGHDHDADGPGHPGAHGFPDGDHPSFVPDVVLVRALDTDSPAGWFAVPNVDEDQPAASADEDAWLPEPEGLTLAGVAAPVETAEGMTSTNLEEACDACFADELWLMELAGDLL
ncbi:MAG TPA: matrixin family metalloprotease [Gemmataceae bacterium]|nr:matrixin family metalloprotease [Gemmataceae bacterium]